MKIIRIIKQKSVLIPLLSLMAILVFDQAQGQETSSNKYGISAEKVEWMKKETIKQLNGCRIKADDGTWVHTPDGVGNYKSLWTRDYCYMVKYAGDLLNPSEIKASIYYLLNGQREDGCIPDRVNLKGEPIYSPGPPGKPTADHAIDNGPFMAMMVTSYVNQFQDKELFIDVEATVRRGLEFVPLAKNGLVYNNPENPQCAYGFTDIIKKSGHLLFSSLLYYESNLEMYELSKKYKFGSPAYYKKNYENVQKSINKLWNEDIGMFWAADKDCKQLDIWGSAYAVYLGITSQEQTDKIVNYLVQHFDEISLRGQIRHLPGSDLHWEKLFKPCPDGTYQNGAYWATPLAWMVPVYAKYKPSFAKDILDAVITDFQINGVKECINNGYEKVPNFVPSATNVYALTR